METDTDSVPVPMAEAEPVPVPLLTPRNKHHVLMSHARSFDLIRMNNEEISRLLAHVQKCEDWFTDQAAGQPVDDLWPEVQTDEVSDGYAAFHLSRLFEPAPNGVDEVYDQDQDDDAEDEVPEEPIELIDPIEPMDDGHAAADEDDDVSLMLREAMAEVDETGDVLDDDEDDEMSEIGEESESDDDADDDDDDMDDEIDEDEVMRIYQKMDGVLPMHPPARPLARGRRHDDIEQCFNHLDAGHDRATTSASSELPLTPVAHDHSYYSVSGKPPSLPQQPQSSSSSASAATSGTKEPQVTTIYLTEEQLKQCSSGKRYILILNNSNNGGSQAGTVAARTVRTTSSSNISAAQRAADMSIASVREKCMQQKRLRASRYCPRAVVRPTMQRAMPPLYLQHQKPPPTLYRHYQKHAAPELPVVVPPQPPPIQHKILSSTKTYSRAQLAASSSPSSSSSSSPSPAKAYPDPAPAAHTIIETIDLD